MPKSGLMIIVSILVLLIPSFLSTENIKIYDQNWNLKYRIENGKIYDNNRNFEARIVGTTRSREGNRDYDKHWQLDIELKTIKSIPVTGI